MDKDSKYNEKDTDKQEHNNPDTGYNDCDKEQPSIH